MPEASLHAENEVPLYVKEHEKAMPRIATFFSRRPLSEWMIAYGFLGRNHFGVTILQL